MKSVNAQSIGRHRPRLFLAVGMLTAASLLLNSCVTQSTAYDVQTKPMTQDLEKKVLMETKVSGAAIGATVGAVAGAVVLGGLVAALGGDGDAITKAAVAGGVIGAVAGGAEGAKKGEQKGKAVVGKGLSRDQLRQLASAAREQNERLASFNADLKRQIGKAGKEPDPKLKKAAYASLRNQGKRHLDEANERLAMRQKALESKNWPDSQKGDYRAQMTQLSRERDSLVRTINQAAALEQAVVY